MHFAIFSFHLMKNLKRSATKKGMTV